MQDRYVPDLGDYSKFGVIDWLCRPGRRDGYRTALLWCLNEPASATERNNRDGRHRAYLVYTGAQRERYERCAPKIYAKLQAIEASKDHRVAAYRERRLFASSVRYFEPMLGRRRDTPDERLARRQTWMTEAERFVESADVVVLDPDNGLSTPTYRRGSPTAAKYIEPGECAALFDRHRRSLIVYQHAHRGGPFEQQIECALARLADALRVDRADGFALRFRRGTARAYLVIPAEAHAATLRRRAEQMLAGPWGVNGHFDTELY